MKRYKIEFEIIDAEDSVSTEELEAVKKIVLEARRNIYVQLKGKCTVKVKKGQETEE